MSIDTLIKVARTSRLSMEYILFGEEDGERDLTPGEALRDEEGMAVAAQLGRNMAWMVKVLRRPGRNGGFRYSDSGSRPGWTALRKTKKAGLFTIGREFTGTPEISIL